MRTLREWGVRKNLYHLEWDFAIMHQRGGRLCVSTLSNRNFINQSLFRMNCKTTKNLYSVESHRSLFAIKRDKLACYKTGLRDKHEINDTERYISRKRISCSDPAAATAKAAPPASTPAAASESAAAAWAWIPLRRRWSPSPLRRSPPQPGLTNSRRRPWAGAGKRRHLTGLCHEMF